MDVSSQLMYGIFGYGQQWSLVETTPGNTHEDERVQFLILIWRDELHT
jgi:hypothetical protein